MSRLTLFFDGGARPNPGRIETAVVARGIAYVAPDRGHGTNSDAEWLAAIHALEVAATLGASEVDLFGDSTLVVRQASGIAPCRSASLRVHRDAFVTLAARFGSVRIRHVKRSHNLAGIALAKRHPR